MVKNTQAGTSGQENTEAFVLGLCSLMCQAEGHTFSWYTSKKGRVWLTFKQNGTLSYSTSVEYDASLSEHKTLDIFALLVSTHIRKLTGRTAAVTTWLGGHHTAEEYAEAWTSLENDGQALFERLHDAGATTDETLFKLLRLSGRDVASGNQPEID